MRNSKLLQLVDNIRILLSSKSSNSFSFFRFRTCDYKCCSPGGGESKPARAGELLIFSVLAIYDNSHAILDNKTVCVKKIKKKQLMPRAINRE